MPTYICDLGADLCEPVPRTLIWGVEEVWAQQRLQGAADGNQEQLGMVVTNTGNRAGGELAKRCFHGNYACGENLRDRGMRKHSGVKAGRGSAHKLLYPLFCIAAV